MQTEFDNVIGRVVNLRINDSRLMTGKLLPVRENIYEVDGQRFERKHITSVVNLDGDIYVYVYTLRI